MYEITASVCCHFLRYSEALCSSGTDVDFDVPYCHNCQRIKDLQRTKDLEAKERYFGKLFECYRGIEEQYPPRRDARRAWDRARIKLANHRAATEEIGKDSSSRPILPSELPNYDHELAQGSRGRTVRIDDEQEGFVDESQYRALQKYFRRHHDYSPGRHADSTGCGFEDTGGWSAFKLEKRSLQQPEEPCSGVNVIFHNWTHSNPVIRPGSTLVSYQDCRLVYLLLNSLVSGQYIHPHNRKHLGPVLRSASPLVLRPDYRLIYPSARRHLTASKSA